MSGVGLDFQSRWGRTFLALQATVTPLASDSRTVLVERSSSIVNSLLAGKPSLLLLKLKLFLFLVDLVALVRFQKGFASLDPESRDFTLRRYFFESPIPILRKGFWGLATMAKAATYGQASVYPSIGYRLKENPR